MHSTAICVGALVDYIYAKYLLGIISSTWDIVIANMRHKIGRYAANFHPHVNRIKNCEIRNRNKHIQVHLPTSFTPESGDGHHCFTRDLENQTVSMSCIVMLLHVRFVTCQIISTSDIKWLLNKWIIDLHWSIWHAANVIPENHMF